MVNSSFYTDDSINPVKKRKSGSGCCFFAFYIPLIFLVFALIGLAIGFFMARKDYSEWNTEFKSAVVEENMVDLKSDYSSERAAIDKKIKTYSDSKNDIDFIQFTPKEIGIIYGEELNSSLPKDFSVENIYIEPGFGQWKFYVKYKYKKISLPWVLYVINKDDLESAELYISDIYVGNQNISDYGMKKYVEDTNEGFRQSLILVNENGFSGRRYLNIELEDSGVTIKGEL